MDIIEIIQGLKKRVNISADTDTTKERARETWKSLTNTQKQEVIALADVGQAVAHNTYKNGHLGAPIAIAMARSAGINPAYLAGMTDKKGRFTQKTLYAFLADLGYDFEDEPPADSAESEPCTELEEDTSEGYTETTVILCDDCETPHDVADEPADAPVLPEDDLYLLLKALLIKAQVSEAAKDTLAEIQKLLIR